MQEEGDSNDNNSQLTIPPEYNESGVDFAKSGEGVMGYYDPLSVVPLNPNQSSTFNEEIAQQTSDLLFEFLPYCGLGDTVTDGTF